MANLSDLKKSITNLLGLRKMIAAPKKNKLHEIIIFIFIAVNFSYILTYAFHNMEFLILNTVVTFTLVLIYQRSFPYIIQLPLSRWLLFYTVIHLIWILLPHSYATAQDVGNRFISIMYLFTLASLLYFDDESLTIARKAILLVTLISIFNHIYELFVPDAFYSLDAIKKIIGRSSGFYGNSTGAGEAIILGMILSYGMVPPPLKVPFLLFALLGVIPTFSRAAIAAWFIVVFILVMTQAIKKKEAVTIGGIVFLLIAIALPIFITFLDVFLGEEAANVLGRLDFFSSKHSVTDASAQSRVTIAKAGFEAFANNPLLGGGLALTYHWAHDISTHNIYLFHMAEFGIVGLFLYPLLLVALLLGARGEARKTGIAFVAFLFIIGFTSHNVLDGFHTLLAIAVMASWSFKSRTKTNPQHALFKAQAR